MLKKPITSIRLYFEDHLAIVKVNKEIPMATGTLHTQTLQLDRINPMKLLNAPGIKNLINHTGMGQGI
jgi:hypothetical protein